MRNPFGIRSQMGIRKRLFFLLLVVFVPLLLLEVFTFHGWYEDRKEAEMQANLELARAVGQNFETFLQGLVRSEVGVGLALTASPSITDQERNRMLDTFAANNPAARSVMWMNPDGLVVAASYRPHIGYNLSDRSFFYRVKEGRNWAVSELIIGRETKKPAVTIGCGIRNEHGRLLGVVAFGTELDRLDTVLAVPRSKGAGVSLIDPKGMHAYRYPPTADTWEQRNWLKLYPVLGEALKGREVIVAHVSRIEGTKRLVAFVPIPSIGWVASCSRAEKEVMAGIVRSLLPQAIMILFVTLGAFGAAVGLSRPITASLLKLRNQAEAVGRGEREQVEIEGAPGELMKLADTLNQMTEKVNLREEALRVSEQRWATTLASVGDAVIATDVEGKITFMNAIAEELTGWTIGEAAMKPVTVVFNIINEQTRKQVENPITKVLREGMVVGLANHTILVKKDGTEIPIDDSGAPIRDREGKTVGVVLVFHDITERKKAEETIRKSEEKYRHLIEHSPAAIYEIDFNERRFKTMNEGICRMLGYTEAELLAMNPMDILDKESREIFSDRIRQAQAGETISDQIEYKAKRKDGSNLWGILHTQFKYTNGKIVGAFVVAHDITERKQAEEERERLLVAVQEEKDRLSALINSIQDEVWFADMEKNFTLANPSALREFGLNGATDIDVRKLAESLEVYRPDGTPRPVEESPPLRALQGEVVTNQEETIRTPLTGELRVRQVSAAPVKDAGGHIVGSVSVVRDTTERKRAEETIRQHSLELQQLNETLEQRVRERTAELANLSSELLVAQEKERKRISYELHDNVWQTLEIIRFQLDELFSGEGEADWPAYHQKAKQLVPVIRSTIARIRSMQGDLWPSVLDDVGIVATLEWYCREFGINHPGLGIEKNVGLAEDEVPASAKIVVYRVMQEALSNIAKHSQASHVSLTLIKSDHRLELSIKDNGVGFDPAEAIAKRSPWGGMGLLSMKQRTELSGGLFDVESAKGKGATVRASWPLSGNN